MKLVADSGSTNTDWYLIEDQTSTHLRTEGYNPYYATPREMIDSIQKELLPQLHGTTVDHIYFYGAGCSHDNNKEIMRNVLSACFGAVEVEVGSDMLAAARATANQQAAICCILGTGTNSCLFDGQKIIDNLPPLGYILGDEGSGAYIGKRLLQAYFYREMPQDLAKKMQASFNLHRHQLLDRLFQTKMPSRFLASFTSLAVKERKHPFVEELLFCSFDTFVQRHLLKYTHVRQLPVHFVGSIAFGFRPILQKALQKHQLQMGTVLQSPFPKLLEVIA